MKFMIIWRDCFIFLLGLIVASAMLGFMVVGLVQICSTGLLGATVASCVAIAMVSGLIAAAIYFDS